jgi:hypothetical protein
MIRVYFNIRMAYVVEKHAELIISVSWGLQNKQMHGSVLRNRLLYIWWKSVCVLEEHIGTHVQSWWEVEQETNMNIEETSRN